MATVLLLAASSFIGRHLLTEFENQGHRVVPTSREPAIFPGGDVCDLLMADDAVRLIARYQPDWVVQCAGSTRTRDPRELYRLHVLGAENLLRAARDHAPSAILVFLGSAAEYGAPPSTALPVAETYPAEPLDFFGASKLAQTHLVRAAVREWDLRGLVLRPANVIGPGLGNQYLAAALVSRINVLLQREGAARELAVINASATRDFVDVRDVARALYLLLDQAPPRAGECEIYNISTGRQTKVFEAARILSQLAGGGIRVIDAGAGEARSGVHHSSCDPRKLVRATGWVPEFSLERSLADVWDECGDARAAAQT